MRATVVAGTIALAWAAAAVPTTACAAPSPGSTHFPRYKELESNVAFWSDVFTKWTSKQIAFHDVEHLDLVYSVLSVNDIVTRLPESQQDDAIRARRKAEGERITAMLRSIADGHARTEEERRILKAIAKIGQEPSYATKLADQVRSQRGLGDRFCEAAARLEAYRPMMSKILAAYDVPEELLALPIVESGYKIGAFSSAGASGIWQFMPATGRLYMEVGSVVDDRRDPRRATEGAARMLRKTYENLGSWPLAITSYNHGPGGIARAVKEMGTTHFGVISRHYKGKAFGFASRNYYAEFLAAADAMKRIDQLCGPIQVEVYAPDEVTLTASAPLRELARAAGTSTESLASMNPALGESVRRGSAKVPRGYRLNLPRGTKHEFEVAFKHVDKNAPTSPILLAKASAEPMPVSVRASAPAREAEPVNRQHKVGRGETLGQIARKYGTTETTLLYMNRLPRSSALKVGQTLTVPADRAIARPPFSKTMTTNATIVAAKEAGQAAAAAALAAQTAAAAVPAAVIEKEEVVEAGGAGAEPAKAAGPAAVAKAATPAAPAKEAAPAVVAKAAAPAAAGKSAASATKDAAPAVVASVARQEPAAAKAEDEAPVLTTEHKVGRGQTLTQIASMYHTSVDELKKMNGIGDASQVQAGQTLKVRTSGSDLVSVATVGRTYRIKSGDTLWSVAKANDTSVETLKRLNPKLASGLRAGDTIKVPSAGAVSVASKVARTEPSRPAAKATPARKTTTAKAAPAKPSYRSHKVQKGQTLSSIAAKYRTSVDTLKRINGIRDAKSVQVGKTLKVPL